MNEAIRTRNPWRTVAMVLIAVLVLLVVTLASMLQPTAPTSAGGRAMPPAAHAASGAGGSNPINDPYIKHHAEVAGHYLQDNPR